VRVLLVLSSGDPGGAELSVTTALRHRPGDVDVRAVVPGPGAVADELRDAGVAAEVVAPRSRRAVARARLVATVDRGVRSFAPDVVHAVGNKAALASLGPARARRVPLVWHKVDFWYDRRGARLLAGCCRLVIAPSRAAGATVPAARLAIVPPPVRIAAGARASDRRPPATIGSVGRLEPGKGHDRVIRAAARLRGDFQEIRVVIAGAPAPYAAGYADHLRAVAREAGLEDRVELLGHVARIEDVLCDLTLLASASHRDERGRGGEALGLALAEAAWVGLPVVATRSGGSDEVVVDGVTGFLVAGPDDLAPAIARLLGDPERARSAGRAGMELARERFAPGPCSARLFAELRRAAR